MTITKIAATIGAAVLLAVSGTVANTSETGAHDSASRTAITRTPRTSSAETVKVRAGDDLVYTNRDTWDFLAVTRMDMESRGTAEMVVGLLDSDYMLGEMDGFRYESTFRIRNAGECKGVEGTLDGTPMYLMACADGRMVTLVLTTDKQVGIEVLQQVYADGAFTVPTGYEEEV